MSLMLAEFFENFRHNLFKPILLFFYMGFLVPILRVEFEFPHVLYQSLTIYLLVAIGWNGGEELAELSRGELLQALEFMGVGFLTNFVIGIIAYLLLRWLTRLRRIDAATVAGYYGSDSAGTYATAKGVLNSLATTGAAGAAAYQFKPYMPVMLAVMEVPGCLVALFLVARLRAEGMDARGYLPHEPGYDSSVPHADPNGRRGGAWSDSPNLARDAGWRVGASHIGAAAGGVDPQWEAAPRSLPEPRSVPFVWRDRDRVPQWPPEQGAGAAG